MSVAVINGGERMEGAANWHSTFLPPYRRIPNNTIPVGLDFNETGPDDRLLRRCPNSPDFCGERTWEIACTVCHIIAVVINIVHIIFLRKINSRLVSSYHNILLNIALADILSSFSMIIKINCAIHHLADGKPRMFTALLSASTDVGPAFRLYILALAEWERIVAVCYQERYSSHILVKYNMLCIAASWTFVTTVVFTRDLIYSDTHCLTTIFGVGNYYAVEPKAITYVLLLVPSAVTVVLVAILMRKLRQSSRNVMDGSGDEIDVYDNTKYILVVTLLFYISYLPTLISFLMSFLGIKVLVLNWIIVWIFAMYGIANIMIFGWMSKSYRTQILQAIGFRSEHMSRRSPDVVRSDLGRLEPVSVYSTSTSL